jgi:hypothetical protein
MFIFYKKHKFLINVLLLISSACPCFLYAIEQLGKDRAENVLFPLFITLMLPVSVIYLVVKEKPISTIFFGFDLKDTVLTAFSTVLLCAFVLIRVHKALAYVPVVVYYELSAALPAIFFILAYIGILIADYTVEGRQADGRLVFALLIIIFLLQFALNGSTRLDAFNMTLMCFSYDFGFISRGLIGSVIKLIAVISGNKLTLGFIYAFSLAALVLWAGLLISLFVLIVKKTETTKAKGCVLMLILAFSLGFGFSTYIRDLGRLDIYLMQLTVIACILIINNKALFLLLPLSLTALLIHQGFIFLYFNLILALLLYRSAILKVSSKRYLLIIIAAVILCSAFFIYLQFFSRAGEGLTLKQIEDYAAGLTGPMYVRTDIIRQELFKEEVSFTGGSLSEASVALLLLSPWLVFFISIWRKSVSIITDRRTKLLYLLLPMGALTLLPLYVMEVDRGRWTYALFFYELILPLALIGMGDKIIESAFCKTVAKLTARPGLSIFVFTYVFVLGPFNIVEINGLSSWLIGLFA